MIKWIAKTEGLFIKQVLSLDFYPTFKDYQAIADAISDDHEERASPTRRERKAKELLDFLEASGIQDPDTKWGNTTMWCEWLEKVEALPFSSLERLALDWLSEYKLLKICQEQMVQKTHDCDLMNEAFYYVENLTRLEMWMFWKSEKDPKTGRSREELGLTGQKMSLTGKRNSETKLSKHRSERGDRFRRMRQLIPILGIDKAAAQVSSEGLGTPSAIKKQWVLAVKAGEEPRLRRKKGTQS